MPCEKIYYSVDSIKSTYNLYVDYLIYRKFSEGAILSKPFQPRVLNSTSTEKVVSSDNFFDVVEITTVKTVKRDKSGFYYTVRYSNLPKTITSLAKEIGVSRQSLGRFKQDIQDLINKREMRQKLGRSFTLFPITLIDRLVKLIDAATITDYHNGLKVMLYMITSIKYFNDGFRHSYQLIADECGVNKDLVMRLIKKMIAAGIIEVKHLGNSVQKYATTYKLTEATKVELSQWDEVSAAPSQWDEVSAAPSVANVYIEDYDEQQSSID